MNYANGLAMSLAVLLTVTYTWGLSTDPDGWGGLVRKSERLDPGGVPLAAVEAAAGQDDALTYAGINAPYRQPPVFHMAPPAAAFEDQEFVAFLGDLRDAVATRDLDRLLEASREDILLSFGYGVGREGLKDILSSPDIGEDHWQALEALFALPVGETKDGTRCAPHFACMVLPPEAGIIDPFDTVFVIDKDVPVYAEASERSEEILTLSFDAVREAAPLDTPDWVAVSLAGGQYGFVPSDKVRSYFDFRADFEKSEDGWKLSSFVAGS